MMGLSRSPFSFAPSKEINEAPGVITSNSRPINGNKALRKHKRYYAEGQRKHGHMVLSGLS